MEKTPNSNRCHIGIFGQTNSGKSTIFNKIIKDDLALVSHVKGTTTDPVKKAMELIPFGPIVLIDTPGIDDDTFLGKKRMEKTFKILDIIDYAIYVIDGNNYNENYLKQMENNFKLKNIPFIIVTNKSDNKIENVNSAINILKPDDKSIEKLSKILIDELSKNYNKEIDLLKGLLEEDSVIVLVVPIDSAAPKGRIILPQVQIIRSALDNGFRCHITNEKGLANALLELKKVDLVITDSQIFKLVDSIVPKKIPLTSFSILFARQKGDINTFIKGAQTIDNLDDGDKVLICEVCSHNTTHEDIGKVKIPKMLSNYTKKI